LCPMAMALGICPDDDCIHLHGLVCPACGRAHLHPYAPEEHDAQTNACYEQLAREHEQQDVEERSKAIDCCICMEPVLEKPTASQRRFGILPNCDHAFCLQCLREWRAKHEQGSAVRSCPICRTISYFVVPSSVWVFSPEEKAAVIAGYKSKMSAIDCMHFQMGAGSCPFGNSCFYRHRYRVRLAWSASLIQSCLPMRLRHGSCFV
ncbi:uncharacterized protein MONBRDRAFT_15555, partial [Monosiga brevicollis MX1]